MLLELHVFSFVNFNNATAFVYAYTVPSWASQLVYSESLTFCIVIPVFLLLTVTRRRVSNKHCLLPLFHSVLFWLRLVSCVYSNDSSDTADLSLCSTCDFLVL